MAESFEVVGDSDEAGFDIYFFNASQVESSESFVLFYFAEDRFDLPSLSSSLDAFFAHQEFFDLFAVAVKIGRALDDAVTCRSVTRPPHRAVSAAVRRSRPDLVPQRRV